MSSSDQICIDIDTALGIIRETRDSVITLYKGIIAYVCVYYDHLLINVKQVRCAILTVRWAARERRVTLSLYITRQYIMLGF